MKNIYLDQNIWIDIQEERYGLSFNLVKNITNYDKVRIVYSPANCEEICNSFRSKNIKNTISEDKKNKRIDIISSLTKNTEIIPYPRQNSKIIELPFGELGPRLIQEHPSICYNRVDASYESNKIAEDNQQIIINTGKGIDQKTKNSISKLEPINDILKSKEGHQLICDKILSKTIFGEAMMQLIHEGELKHPITDDKLPIINHRANLLARNIDAYISEIHSTLSKQNIYEIISQTYHKMETYIDSIVLTLIQLGYASENKSMSSLHDVSHIIYGSCCDYFITRDEKLIKKAIPTYNYLKASTKVIDASDNNWIKILQTGEII
ncbi:hypothetical protein VL10_05545 [Leclercia adecarboxylata]|nr:hypothetical protein VL10_05545 [Leclercia adecarboxylata]KMN66440.1 hypothetical protein VK95_05140 [Leclercia sp. LK8]